jgi:hypothetical protein
MTSSHLEKGPCVTPGSTTGRPLRGVPWDRAIDGPLLAYGLVTGILAVSAGVAVSSPLDRLGVTRQLVAVATTLVIASLATVFASRILGWVLAAPTSAQAQDPNNNGRTDREH